ncbi:MAG: family 10 glycosylhydrolase [Candidatus Hydrogenedentales bacterium]|jgi:uncharacterized lipoprotein YddW (UPF0748 family)
MKHVSIVLGAGILWVFCARGAELPVPPAPLAGQALPGMPFTTSEAARAAFKAVGNTAPIDVVEAGGRTLLRMPCVFEGVETARAVWDWYGRLDLTRCQGLQFNFYSPDTSPVSYFSLYLRSGEGWYHMTFGAKAPGQWTTVVFDKSATELEGRPQGWGNIDLVRIAAWRGKHQSTEFYVADLSLYGADAPIGIVRNESAAAQKSSEYKTVAQCTGFVAEQLGALGIPFIIMSDLDLSNASLRDKQLVILPYNPSMSDPAVQALARYLERGGKLISFYRLDSRLAALMGVKSGRYVGRDQNVSFASIRATGTPLDGQPAEASQHSWNIHDVLPVDGKSRAVATWYDEAGLPTGCNAIVASANAVHMSHILLSEDPVRKRRLLLAMTGHLLPELWRVAAQHALAGAGAVGGYPDLASCRQGLMALSQQDPTVDRYLSDAESLRARASELAGNRRFPEALEVAEEIQHATLQAYCAAQKPLPGEHRAYWCHSAYGVDGVTWDEAIRRLADNGFTAILPNMVWGGVAFYPSDVLPTAAELAQRGDQVAQCLAACRKYGLECHVWKVCWNMGTRAPKSFMDRMKSEGRTQVSVAGVAQPQWLCPSHPANQQLEIESLVELVRKYDVDGIHFDYIRYPSSEYCFCAGCRTRFEQQLNRPVAHWPRDVGSGGRDQDAWLEFRRQNITKVVAGVHDGARKARPGIKISAAVFRSWPHDRDTVGQDWKLWCDRGYLDFLCPMNYTPHNDSFRNMTAQQRAWTANVPSYPGIGQSTWLDRLDAVKLIEQIAITRELGTGGFTVFNYGTAEYADLLPLCGMGITRKP